MLESHQKWVIKCFNHEYCKLCKGEGKDLTGEITPLPGGIPACVRCGGLGTALPENNAPEITESERQQICLT